MLDTLRRNLTRSLVLAFLLGIGLTVALGASGNIPGFPTQTVGVAYYADKQAGTQPFRSATSVADTASFTTAILTSTTCPHFFPQGRPTASVSPRFTQPGQSCVVQWLAVDLTGSTYQLTIASDPITLTAMTPARTDQAGKFLGTGWAFDTWGAVEGRVVIVTPPASGTVELWVGSK